MQWQNIHLVLVGPVYSKLGEQTSANGVKQLTLVEMARV